MDAILNIKGIKLNLNFEEQLSPQGRPIRLSGISKNLKMPEKYVDKSYKNHWIYTFRYLGTDSFISFEFDYYGKFVGVKKS
jgi:hypothetical protein